MYLNNTSGGAYYCCNRQGFVSSTVADMPFLFRKLILLWPFLKLTCRRDFSNRWHFKIYYHVKILLCVSVCSW